MKSPTIKNRDTFLETISKRLNRERMTMLEKNTWTFSPANQLYADFTTFDLLEMFQKQCKVIETPCYVTNVSELANRLFQSIQELGGKNIITWAEHYYTPFQINELLHSLTLEGYTITKWDTTSASDTIIAAEKADIAITVSDITLAESGTVTKFVRADRGRLSSFLPKTDIVLVPLSTLVPRMTQAAAKLQQMHDGGELIPSCIQFITGPSNSADIELNLVVGVHGPVNVHYLIIEDL